MTHLIFCRIFKYLISILGLLIISLFTAGLIFYITLPDVSTLAVDNPTTTAFIELRRVQSLQKGIDFEPNWKWVPLSKISPYLVNSLIYTEDITFWTHGGIEWNSIVHALKIFWNQHRFVTGGSSISQQVAKNLYLSPDRTLLRKGREMLLAMELERCLNKERILEIYLNIIEWGDNIFGIEAASQYWFNCAASELTPNQAINLALIVPNPRHRNPRNPPPAFKRGINQLLLMLAQDGILSDEMAIDEMKIDIPLEPLKEDIIYKMF